MSSGDGEQGFEAAAFARRFDHHAPEFADHMHGVFRHMRDQCPVARSDAYGGFWVVTRYDDIVKVVRDDDSFSVEAGLSIPSNRKPGDAPFAIPPDLDPPLSRAYRSLFESFVSPKALMANEPMLRNLARELVNGFIEKGKVDLVREFAVPLTAIATMRLAGLPEGDWPRYVSDRVQASESVEDPQERMQRLQERFAWTRNNYLEQARIQRTHPIEGGVLAHLVNAKIDGRLLEDWEIQAMMTAFVAGGLETTQALLGSAWVYLARNPEQRRTLTDDMSLMGTAVEEMLRYFTPQSALCRIAKQDVDVGGVQIKTGERVLMCWGSANRDDAKFENPQDFDPRRKQNRHLSFGMGAHHCMGANLTRLEARICLEEILRRLPDYALVEMDVVRIPDVSMLYGYLAVPVTFSPGKRIPA